MFQIFDPIHSLQLPSVQPTGFDLIKRTYTRELSNIVSHYNNRPYYLDNSHILVRLLNSFTISPYVPLSKFIEIANTRAPYIAKLLNLTSSITYGRIQPGTFYGNPNKEIIISLDKDLYPFSLPSDWKSIKAINVLEHPISDLGLMLPNGKLNSSIDGLCVTTIDIPLLMYQFRCFQLDRYNLMMSETVLSTNQFINMYVLPNMLYSHIELVLMNRLMNLFYGAPMSVATNRHSFQITKYDTQLDNVLWQVIKRLSKHKVSYSGYLQNIPSFIYKDITKSLYLPELVKTKQLWWSQVLTRLRIIKFLIDIGGHEGIIANRSNIGNLQVSLKRMQNENTLRMVLTKDMFFDINEIMNDILNL